MSTNQSNSSTESRTKMGYVFLAGLLVANQAGVISASAIVLAGAALALVLVDAAS